MKRLLLILLVGLVCLAGNVVEAIEPEFLGISLLDANRPEEAFTKVTRNEDGSVSYECTSLADPDIYCWGHTGEGRINWEKIGKGIISEGKFNEAIVFLIVNNSKRPIEMNYFTDEYRLIDYADNIYKLKILSDISSYPDVLNPGDREGVRVSNPFFSPQSEGIEFPIIKHLLVSIDYGKIVIFLRRIEEE